MAKVRRVSWWWQQKQRRSPLKKRKKKRKKKKRSKRGKRIIRRKKGRKKQMGGALPAFLIKAGQIGLRIARAGAQVGKGVAKSIPGEAAVQGLYAAADDIEKKSPKKKPANWRKIAEKMLLLTADPTGELINLIIRVSQLPGGKWKPKYPTLPTRPSTKDVKLVKQMHRVRALSRVRPKLFFSPLTKAVKQIK